MAAPLYSSTRRASPQVSFREALLKGLAPDGGLFVPVKVPSVPAAAWHEAASFTKLAQQVLAYWLREEVEADALDRLVADALFFDAPLVPLGEDLYILELFHGPTLSFKDFGARTMARLMAHFLRDRDDTLTILVATSGDTGSAVADGFAGQDHIRVVLLYPKGQVSPVQERQLIVARPGVEAYGVEGTFDDCQRMVKEAFVDPDLAGVPLSSANSINIGRLLPQMLYYFWAVRQGSFDEVLFCTPSGNLGNLTGGVLAALSGLPVQRFLAAHNANDFFPTFLRTRSGDFSDSVRTLSNAMDVGAPSNFERLRYLLPGEALPKRIWGTSVSDGETVERMKTISRAAGYVADPHTAVGLEAVRRYREATGEAAPVVVLSTAHPAKFPETIEQALGFAPEAPERLARLWDEPTRVEPLAPTGAALKAKLLAHA